MSSSDIAISVRGISKAYTIAHNAEKHSTLAETMLHRIRNVLKPAQKETFAALTEVSFDVHKGEVVGIIGRNGAGKSTLLKILSRITEPTAGQIDVYGRVGSLLEVGTGFHPELTGRENIFLNGAILGMRRREIQKQFDAIVDFAEIEKFLDTPVKRYSSGMYVRLAFAVAAHLNPEILVVDEVLAVGDGQFQKKCLGKMQDVSRQEGRTVLFVSHNMGAVKELCVKGLLLRQGEVDCFSTVEDCLQQYVAPANSVPGTWRLDGHSKLPLKITCISVTLAGTQPNHRLAVHVELATTSSHAPAFIAVDIFRNSGEIIMQAIPNAAPFIVPVYKRHRLAVTVDLPPLVPGHYLLSVWVGPHNTETFDMVERRVSFEVQESPTHGRTFPHHGDHGYIVPASRVEYNAG